MVLHVKHTTLKTAYMNALIIQNIKYNIMFIKYISMIQTIFFTYWNSSDVIIE